MHLPIWVVVAHAFNQEDEGDLGCRCPALALQPRQISLRTGGSETAMCLGNFFQGHFREAQAIFSVP